MGKTTSYIRQLCRKPVVWLAVIAAITYSSWPLGYILNPAVGKHELASQLEAPHQPYNWLFISTDVLTGIILMLAGMIQLRAHRKQTILALCIISCMAFGLLVILAAAIPINCVPETASCGPLIHRPAVLVHGFASIFSVLFLFFSLVALGILTHVRETFAARRVFAVVVACWGIFGIGSVLDMLYKFGGNALQYYFITICSLSIILVVAAIEYYGTKTKDTAVVPSDKSAKH